MQKRGVTFRRTTMSITRWNPLLLLLLSIAIPAGIPMGIAAAQSQTQGDALADAARRAQADKKNEASGKKVWTTDNIPRTPGDISIVGTVTPSSPDKAASAPGTPVKTRFEHRDDRSRYSHPQADSRFAKLLQQTQLRVRHSRGGTVTG